MLSTSEQERGAVIQLLLANGRAVEDGHGPEGQASSGFPTQVLAEDIGQCQQGERDYWYKIHRFSTFKMVSMDDLGWLGLKVFSIAFSLSFRVFSILRSTCNNARVRMKGPWLENKSRAQTIILYKNTPGYCFLWRYWRKQLFSRASLQNFRFNRPYVL